MKHLSQFFLLTLWLILPAHAEPPASKPSGEGTATITIHADVGKEAGQIFVKVRLNGTLPGTAFAAIFLDNPVDFPETCAPQITEFPKEAKDAALSAWRMPITANSPPMSLRIVFVPKGSTGEKSFTNVLPLTLTDPKWTDKSKRQSLASYYQNVIGKLQPLVGVTPIQPPEIGGVLRDPQTPPTWQGVVKVSYSDGAPGIIRLPLAAVVKALPNSPASSAATAKAGLASSVDATPPPAPNRGP